MYFPTMSRLLAAVLVTLALPACVTTPLRPPAKAEPSAGSQGGNSLLPGPSTARSAPPGQENAAPPFKNTASNSAPQTGSPPEPSPAPDIWARIRAGFELNGRDHPSIQAEIRQYVTHPDYLERIQDRARPLLFFILEELQERGMPTELALLPVVESAFQPFAYSPDHAAGIWQFIPSTARYFGLEQNWWYDGRRDIVASTRAALRYLQRLHRSFNEDWELALAAYNAGEGSVRKAIRKNRRLGKATDFWSLDLPRETRAYVPRLLAFCRIIATPDRFGIKLRPIANRPQLATVDIKSQLDLALAAEMAEMSADELYRLNPGFNRWATAPQGPHLLLLPLDRTEDFEARLNRLDPSRRIRWLRYRIKPGDSLSVIAARHGITTTVLRQANNLRSSRIRAGRHLLIPVSASGRQAHMSPPARRQNRGRNKPLSYTVRRGDTLWDIGRAYKVSYRKLARWNDLAPSDTLHPKQKLLIWKKTGY